MNVQTLHEGVISLSSTALFAPVRRRTKSENQFLPHLINFSFSDWSRTVGDESPCHGSRHSRHSDNRSSPLLQSPLY